MPHVPKIVLKQLQSPASEHLDADLLTAFAEQLLPESERNLVLCHLSLCSDCRDVIALALPATDAVDVAVPARPARAGWLTVPTFRWGVVAAGVLVVASFGVLQYRQMHPGKERQLAAAVVPHEPINATPVQTPAASTQTSAPRAALPHTEGKMQLDKRVEARKQFPNIFPQSKSASDAGTGLGTNAPAAATVEAQGSAPALATNTSVPQASDQLAQNQGQQSPLQGRDAVDLSVARAKDPVPAAAAAMQAPSIALHTSPSLMLHAAARWMITSSGGLRRSLDAGLTWEDVQVESSSGGVENMKKSRLRQNKAMQEGETQKHSLATPNPVFRALAATGSEVWAGGSNAVLYHSLDTGAHWMRVLPSSAGTELSGDITAVDFSDLQHGRITTSTPEVWTTADDGHTWQKQP